MSPRHSDAETMQYSPSHDFKVPPADSSDKASSGSSSSQPLPFNLALPTIESFYVDNDADASRRISSLSAFSHRVIDSFRRARPRQSWRNSDGSNLPINRDWSQKDAAMGTASTMLSRHLKGRHLQMIAIGGSIGTGLFVASGQALASGGPASLVIAFSLVGIMLYCTIHALGELAVVFPIAGSFSAYSTRFIDPAWGFAMGWNYAMQWLVVLPLEIIAASITINYWNENVDHAVFVTIFFLLIVGINLFGIKGYGEAEFVFAIIKVVAVIGFILLGIIINIGGSQTGGYIGGKYWQDPGAFNQGLKGLCSVFVTAAFAFGGTELMGLAAAETANPRKSIPTACKQVFWRITLFYMIALTVVGMNVPHNDPRLLQGGSANAAASPFVIAINDAGIEILPSVMNIVILVAVVSVGNSSVYGSSRTLAALADQGQAPRILGYVDRKGRPLAAILLASAFGLLAFLADSGIEGDVLAWMLATSGLSSVLTWFSICLSHIRFRSAWKYHGHSLDELAFQSQPGVLGSYAGLCFNSIVLIAQFWTCAWPDGYGEMAASERFVSFFQQYLAAFVVLLFFSSWKLWYRTPYVKVRDMDVHTGARDLDLTDLLKMEREERSTWPRWKKCYRVVC